jgi:hypothetical protein
MDSVAKMSQLHKSHCVKNVTVAKMSQARKSGKSDPPPWEMAPWEIDPTVGIGPPWKLVGQGVKKVLDPHRGK